MSACLQGDTYSGFMQAAALRVGQLEQMMQPYISEQDATALTAIAWQARFSDLLAPQRFACILPARVPSCAVSHASWHNAVSAFVLHTGSCCYTHTSQVLAAKTCLRPSIDVSSCCMSVHAHKGMHVSTQSACMKPAALHGGEALCIGCQVQ